MKLLLQDLIGAHYRLAIYKLMAEQIGCDFCFGDRWEDIKTMDFTQLPSKVTILKNVRFPFFYLQRGLLRFLRSDYDTYILNGEPRCLTAWLFMVGKRIFFPSKRILLWGHGLSGKEGFLKHFIVRVFYKLSDGAFIYNERSSKLLATQGISPVNLHPIYNSLDYDSQLPIRKNIARSNIYSNHFHNDLKNLIFIGRLTPIKQLHLLIEAVSVLREAGTQVNVTFVGDGSERARLEQLAKERNLQEQIWFAGACYDEYRNAEFIYNADLCVSPGNIGLTAIHVMMFGCPIITHNDFALQMPEFEAISNGVTGTFFEAGNSHALAESICSWLNTHADRISIREACYCEIDTKWNPHHQIEIIKKVLFE